MTDHQNEFDKLPTENPGLPWKQLMLGVFAPITIFYILHRFGHPLTGAFLAISWSIGLLTIKYWRSKNVDLFPALAIPVVFIELVGTIITRNPNFYLASAAIDNGLWSLLFLSSLFFPRPIIQVFAELVIPRLGTIEFLDHFNMPVQLYQSAWKILTSIWGVIYLIKTFVLILSQIKLPLEVFLIIRTVSGLPVLVIMLFFSYRFPGWYWERVSMQKES